MLIEEEVARLLRERGMSISTAEACTGGLIGARLSSVPGASRFFPGGVIAYSHRSKVTVLGVPELAFLGGSSVNREGVLAMARTARQLFDTDVAVAESGVAGPTGGNPERPVGTFYIALAARDGHEAVKHHVWDSNRSKNQERAAQVALEMARAYLEDQSSS